MDKKVADVDKDWFEQLLAKKGRSQNDMARHIGVDPSAMSRTLNGVRKMQINEANEIARFLGAPVSEVLKHAGVAVDLDGMPTRILLAATVDGAGTVKRLPDPKPLPQSIIDRARAAIHLNGNGLVIAAQVRANKGPLAAWDDAVVLFGHTENVDSDAIGSLAVCRLFDGEQIIAKIERARKTGEAKITTFANETREVVLQTATPVIAVIP